MMPPEAREGLHQSLREGISSGASVVSTLHLVLSERVWEYRVDRHGREWRFGSFIEYLTADPPGGLYTKLADIRPLIDHDIDLLSMFDEAVQGTHGGDRSKSDNIQDAVPAPSGTSKQAAVRRLRKERPDLLEKVKAGEISAHAAAVEAGFRKRPSVLDVLRAAWRKASKDERQTFLAEVTE
jgi:hypothetical protein